MSTLEQKQIFKIRYDDLENPGHTIDAELLGHAILNTASVLKHTSKVLNGETSEIDLDVQAHTEGSFIVEFVTYLNNVGVNPLSLLGFGGATVGAATVLSLLKEIKAQPVKAIIDLGQGKSRLELRDGREIETDSNLAKLVVDQSVRKNIEKIVADPFEGVSKGTFKILNAEDEDIIEFEVDEEENDLESFKAPARSFVEEKKVEEKDTEIRFVKVNFYGPTGWSIQLPNNDTVSIKMKDEQFLSRIYTNQSISKADLFVAKIKTTTTFKTGKSPSIDRELIKVKRHRTSEENKLIKDDE